MTPPAYADCSHSDEATIDSSDDCQEDFHMYVELTERERLDIENRLLREMAAAVRSPDGSGFVAP